VDEEMPVAKRSVWPVSAVTGAGLAPLLSWVGPLVRALTAGAAAAGEVATEMAEEQALTGVGGAAPAVETSAGGRHVTYRPEGAGARAFSVRRGPAGFVVEGRAVKRLVSRFDLTDEEAIRYLGERLDRLGVYAALRAQGAQPGDDVDIEGYDFEFQ
jgi:GTPase